ncbi:MAG: aldo/keto reductase [Betaproteobacteria bacterium AqS2]|uniref:Aldo/keto reductase n=1 Tax=Candidatus Amphirhobacter heronislandensis TaxID=1732024 RepID=A0A930UGW3_9GAMM|nr:aldo/keto reductase [Betaproteobacteria bacterium AqS2]
MSFFPASRFGIGTATLGNMFRPINEFDVADCLRAAWDGGVRLFDTAPFYGYGLAERRLGDFLRTKPREDFIISNKVGRMLVPRRDAPPTDTFFLSTMPFNPVYDYSYDGAMRSFEDSLQRTGLDRFDIMLIHDPGVAEHGDRQPEVFRVAIDGAAKAMVELREQGVISAVGVGTNEWEVAERAIKEADLDTCLLAGRYTLLEQHAAASLMPLCVERGVKLILGGVFNSGLLVSDDIPNATWNYQPAPPEQVKRALQLKEICARHGVPLPAAAIQFALAHPAAGAVVVGARSRKESEESLRWRGQEIPPGLWADLVDEGLLAAEAAVPSAS